MEDISEYVRAYRRLRDGKAKVDAAYKKKTAPLIEMMDKIENQLLRLANEHGVQSFTTEHGTAYKNKATYCKMSDWDAFQDGLIAQMVSAIYAQAYPDLTALAPAAQEGFLGAVTTALKHCGAWEYLTRAANKTVITELAATGEVVPGIELTSEIKMGFRAPTKARS